MTPDEVHQSVRPMTVAQVIAELSKIDQNTVIGKVYLHEYQDERKKTSHSLILLFGSGAVGVSCNLRADEDHLKEKFCS